MIQNAWCANGDSSTDSLKRANLRVVVPGELDQNPWRKSRDGSIFVRIERFEGGKLFRGG